MNTGPVHTTTRVIINVELSGQVSDIVPDDRGNRIMPKSLTIEYLNGRLWACGAHGPRVRSDGHPWLDGAQGYRSWMGYKQRGLMDRTPEWVRELVDMYSPGNRPVSMLSDSHRNN